MTCLGSPVGLSVLANGVLVWLCERGRDKMTASTQPLSSALCFEALARVVNRVVPQSDSDWNVAACLVRPSHVLEEGKLQLVGRCGVVACVESDGVRSLLYDQVAYGNDTDGAN